MRVLCGLGKVRTSKIKVYLNLISLLFSYLGMTQFCFCFVGGYSKVKPAVCTLRLSPPTITWNSPGSQTYSMLLL